MKKHKKAQFSDNDSEDGFNRTTSEKPISLHPLPFEDTLRGLLNTPPPPNDKKHLKKKKPN